jgi:hypothetical protein
MMGIQDSFFRIRPGDLRTESERPGRETEKNRIENGNARHRIIAGKRKNLSRKKCATIFEKRAVMNFP